MTDGFEPEEDAVPRSTQKLRQPTSFLLLVFGFGLAAGFLLAFSGYGLEDSAALVISIFLTLILLVCFVGILAFLFRKRLMKGMFGIAEAQIENFAGPLARVAEGTAERDTKGATSAARDLLQLTFARYAWVSTRRWIIGSLTGLIAAMAALSGTALLFKQNQLLEVQSGFLQKQTDLLARQNERIGDQTTLLQLQVELAEAARNAGLAVEMLNIAALLGAAVDKSERLDRDAGRNVSAIIPVLDPYEDIGQSLRMRIISASRSSRPYRFLRPDLHANDEAGKFRFAARRRKSDLPQFYASVTGPKLVIEGASTVPGLKGLIDRPASPERAQLLQILMSSGLRDLETLNLLGLELAFAYGPDMRIFGVSAQGSSLSYADFERAQITGSDFGGSFLQNARFDKARIERSLFRSIIGKTGKGPFNTDATNMPSMLVGASFEDAFLRDIDFTQARASLASFDAATLHNVVFTDSTLAGATFRGAVLLNVGFKGAALNSVDFDDAIVGRGDFLDRLEQQAVGGTFKRARFTIREVSIDKLLRVDSAFAVLEAAEIAEIVGGQTVWKITRVGDFEQP